MTICISIEFERKGAKEEKEPFGGRLREKQRREQRKPKKIEPECTQQFANHRRI